MTCLWSVGNFTRTEASTLYSWLTCTPYSCSQVKIVYRGLPRLQYSPSLNVCWTHTSQQRIYFTCMSPIQ